MDADPVRQFGKWFREAKRSGTEHPESMALATATRDGRPSVRMMLLKGFDGEGFVFYTNYESDKARQLEENPHTAMVFHWPLVGRQVRVEGKVRKLARRNSARYFETRSRRSRLAAWISPQSRIVPWQGFLEERFRTLSRKYRGKKEVPLPPFWGGYRLLPEAMEFWQSGPYRMHDRFRYEKTKAGWRILQLAP
jgi:pyridoxamine 5'-phosphate oxidase